LRSMIPPKKKADSSGKSGPRNDNYIFKNGQPPKAAGAIFKMRWLGDGNGLA